MTDEALIARLRVDEPMCEEHFTANLAADRIEALIAERDASEAKLAKAVGALMNIDALDPENLVGGCSRDALSALVNRMGDIARATLAEIKGESHE